MSDVMLIHAAADRLRLIIRRGVIWPDERDDIKIALDILGVDLADPDTDHLLADLYKVLHATAGKDEPITLGVEHMMLLSMCVEMMDR